MIPIATDEKLYKHKEKTAAWVIHRLVCNEHNIVDHKGHL